MAETGTHSALLPPGTTLGLFCGGVAFVCCLLPWVSLTMGALGLYNTWWARRAVRREPQVYRESGLRVVTRLLIFTAWMVTALVLLAGHGGELPVPPAELW